MQLNKEQESSPRAQLFQYLRNFTEYKEQDPNTGSTLSQRILRVVAEGGFKAVRR